MRAFWTLLLVASCIGALVGCDKPPAQAAPPPPSVTVSFPLQREVIDWDEYTGYLASPETANVSARVSGLIQEAPFQEGAMVHKDDVLFVIDPGPFQADYDSKKAAVAQAQAQLDQAKVHFDRYAKVRGTQAISEDDYDAANAAYEQAQAALAGAKAAEETANLNLKWTHVTAPISGRISKKYVTVGNLVTGGGTSSGNSGSGGGGGGATLLTTIVSVDPLYCYIAVPEDAFLKYHDLSDQERRAGQANTKIPVYLQLGNETNFPHEGTIDFIDNAVDPGTGTIQVRGVFPNPDGRLVPGLFARMRIPESGRYLATLIPAAAISVEQNEQYLLVVDENDVVQRRNVEFGREFGLLRVVTSGLELTDRVIVNGLQSARPGAKVNATEAPIPASDLKQLESLQETAAGSPTTQSLPATQPTATTQPAMPNAAPPQQQQQPQ